MDSDDLRGPLLHMLGKLCGLGQDVAQQQERAAKQRKELLWTKTKSRPNQV